MKKFIQRVIRIISPSKDDPVFNCPVHLERLHGCPFVDGYLCDMKSCPILRDYESRKASKK